MDNQKSLDGTGDISGFDIMSDGTPVLLPETKTSFESETPLPQQHIPVLKVFNMSEITVRWGCTRGYVERQISRGFPMRKMSNNRWEITERELLQWETMRNDQEIESERKRGQHQTIQIVVMIFVILILAVLIYMIYHRMAPFDMIGGGGFSFM